MFRFLERRDEARTEKAVEKTRRAWFRKVATLFQRTQLDDGLWDELEELLISADVGVATADDLLQRVRQWARDEGVNVPAQALNRLKAEMVSMLDVDSNGGPSEAGEPPLTILMVGVNGAGKTTSLAKLANLYQAEGKQVLLGAADTFRAAAIEQLQAWGQRLKIDVIAHQAGADPGAVVFDTIQAAISRGADVVIVDTAGRLHTRANLVEELRKIHRVMSRQVDRGSQRVLLALDATVGQNGLVQARAFIEAVNCDGVFLAKLDGTAKGGIVLAIAHQLKLPIMYIGTGEQPCDIASFDAEEFVEGLFSSPRTND